MNEATENMALKKPKVLQAEIVKGGKLTIPDGVKLDDVIDLCQRMKKYEEEVVNVRETIDCFPWDGAYALGYVLKERFGWASAEPIPSMFGTIKPKVIAIESDYGQTVQVCWGEFSVPGIDGKIGCGADNDKGLLKFILYASVRRKYEATIKAVAEDIRAFLKTSSIYRGKSVSIQFRDEDGKRMEMAEVKFLDVKSIDEDGLVFPEEVSFEINNYFFTHLERRSDVLYHDVPGKWGVLLEGPPGTGKTLAAMVAAKKANRNGITVVYGRNIQDFNDAMLFAVQYAPAVLFFEDIDRIGAGERDAAMDRILNVLDGIETKKKDVMVVLTSNNVEAIQPVMLRNGRVDVVIHITPPDQQAAIQLLHLYGGTQIKAGEDLNEVGLALSGYNPAAVRSCVDRAKLSAIRKGKPGEKYLELEAEDLLAAAYSLKRQMELVNRKPTPQPSKLEIGANIIGKALTMGLEKGVADATQHIGVDAVKHLMQHGNGRAAEQD